MSNLAQIFAYHYKHEHYFFREFLKRIKMYLVAKSAQLNFYVVTEKQQNDGRLME